MDCATTIPALIRVSKGGYESADRYSYRDQPFRHETSTWIETLIKLISDSSLPRPRAYVHEV